MADNETTGSNKPVATDKVTYSGDADQNVQLVRSVQTTGSEGSRTVVDWIGEVQATPTADTLLRRLKDILSLTVLAAGANKIGSVELFKPTAYCWLIPSQVHVAAANTVHWDMFNADATAVVRVTTIRQIPNITTAVTGVVFDWLLERTTAVGTGGSALTAWLPDLNDTALDADITCRSKPTGGATASTDLFRYSLSSEETNAATIQIASQGGLELVPAHLLPPIGKGIVLRQNQGIRCVQETNSNAGNTGWLIGFTVNG